MKHHIAISDHALIRYLERIEGFDIQRLRQEITQRIAPFVIDGISGVIIDGHTYVVGHGDNGPVLVTILPRGATNRARSAERQTSRRKGRS